MSHGAHPLFGTSPIPRYVHLADIFRQRIARGQWSASESLPSIDALMQEFGVARVTVRQAINLLTNEGLVSPQRGRGTFVTRRAGADRRLRVETTLADLVEMYRGDTPQLINLVETTGCPVLSAADGLAAPKYFYMQRVHSRDGERYCVISIYLDHRIFRRAPKRFRREVILPILVSLRGVTIARARQTLTISTADIYVASQIGIPANAPVAEVRRVLCGPDGTVIYVAEITYRGDYIHLEMDLKP
jgi:GntR family transcriptional regulator